MQKVLYFIFTVIFLIFTTVPAIAQDTEFLYFVKNTNSSNVKNIADFYSRQMNMPVVQSEENYTNVCISNMENYFFAVEQSNDNVYFYFYSPKQNTKILKEILLRFKNNGLKYSKISLKNFDTNKYKKNYKNSFTQTDLSIINEPQMILNEKNNVVSEIYDFSDEAQQRYNTRFNSIPVISYTTVPVNDKAENNRTKNKDEKLSKTVVSNNSEQKYSAIIEKMEPFHNINLSVVLQSTINTASLEENDRISALLQNNLYIDNKLIAKQGSIVYGTVLKTEKAGRAYADGSIQLSFDKILTTEGEELTLQIEPVVYSNQQSHRSAKIAGNLAGAIALGTALSAIAGSIGETDNWGRTLAVGAGIGAVTGGFSVLSATGEEFELKEGTVLHLKAISLQ